MALMQTKSKFPKKREEEIHEYPSNPWHQYRDPRRAWLDRQSRQV
jgi:hypothetical protein